MHRHARERKATAPVPGVAMAMRSETVMLDHNVLGWCYKPPNSFPKKFNLARERAALEELAKLENPKVVFVYHQGHLKYYADHLNQIHEDLRRFRVALWAVTPAFGKELDYFISSLRVEGEKQDDIEFLAVVSFVGTKRIRRILTFDYGFIKRLSQIHARVRTSDSLRRWVLQKRRDFFSIKPCLPSELLEELRKR